MQYKNFHILTVSYYGPTNHTQTRIRIKSERFKAAYFIGFHDSTYSNTIDIACEHLRNEGYNIIGIGEGKNCYYVITDTFGFRQKDFTLRFKGRKFGAQGVTEFHTIDIKRLTHSQVLAHLNEYYECVTEATIDNKPLSEVDITSPGPVFDNLYQISGIERAKLEAYCYKGYGLGLHTFLSKSGHEVLMNDDDLRRATLKAWRD